MKRIKKIYQENRILVILMTIVLICVVIMGICLVNYFYGTKNSTVYGKRLDGIESVKIEDSKASEIEDKIVEEETVDKAYITLTGKIIYIKIEFNESITLVDAKNIALKALDYFSDEEKKYYDFQFTLKQLKSDKAEGFIISGAKNRSGSNLVWNNNLEVEEEKEPVAEETGKN